MNEHGATLIEIIAVLLIMGIVSAVAVSRFANLEDMETATRVTTVRNHIRYAQVMAMKRNDMTWGIKCDTAAYWVFKTAAPAVATEPDDTDNIVYLPGNENKKITISDMDGFTLYFDEFGIPYEYDAGTGNIERITTPKSILIGSRTLTVTPETGFIE
jgi:prepilin-type N-terminal cleavage/methylation domain-containing protein